VSLFKACDLRGVVGTELNVEVAYQVGLSLGNMVQAHGGGPVCLGGDFRRTTLALKAAVLTGLLETGAVVFEVGQNPTPVIYFAAAHLGCPNVAIVTASHNPTRYNGLKFMVAGRPAIPSLVKELESGMKKSRRAAPSGRVRRADVLPEYKQHVLAKAAEVARSTPLRLKNRRLKIVVDAMNGAFSHLAPLVLTEAGCEVIKVACTPDPDFSERDPNPANDQNLGPLAQAVAQTGADFGVALDGDGDRVAFMDQTGKSIRPEQAGVLFARHCFQRPLLVYDLKCASILASAVASTGGEAIMQPSGHGFIKTMMIDREADLGVEVSGHFFFKALRGCDDGLFATLLMAHILASSGATMSELIRPIPWPLITPDLRIPLTPGAEPILERILAKCGGEVTRLDGVRAQYAEGWALARLSITEPVITLRFEGKDQAGLRRIAEQFLAGAPELLNSVQTRLG
jgi:phosphomannomutase / phosphoglucomutase